MGGPQGIKSSVVLISPSVDSIRSRLNFCMGDSYSLPIPLEPYHDAHRKR